jgi:flotillin
MPYTLIFVAMVALFLVATIIAVMSRYHRCPSNRILVKYGNVGRDKAALPIHGGATFVWPVLQSFAFLDLTPMTIDIDLKGALSKQNIRMNVPSRFTIGIATDEEGMNNAAVRLLGESQEQIEALAKDIIFGQLRATIATMNIEEINAEREIFEQKVTTNVETELKKIGLRFINVNIADVQDESLYLQSLGKRAAAEAVNAAKVAVADQDRSGAVGAAEADREQRIQVASANATAVTGENESKVNIANSDAARRVAQAEAKRLGDAADLVKAAGAETEGFVAQTAAQEARAATERARQTADVVVPAEIAKQRLVIEAEAGQRQVQLAGEAKGAATKAELEGEADGTYALLSKKAQGFKELVEAAGSAEKAFMLMVAEQLPMLAEVQAKAISNIKFDKIVVMDGGGANGGGSTTADWLSGVTKMLPGLHLFAEMAGMELPAALGRKLNGEADNDIAPATPLAPL